jgi:hypothetical protein
MTARPGLCGSLLRRAECWPQGADVDSRCPLRCGRRTARSILFDDRIVVVRASQRSGCARCDVDLEDGHAGPVLDQIGSNAHLEVRIWPFE